MVDFDKLRAKAKKPKPVDPIEVFRRLPKPPGINDLYNSQAEVLQAWSDRRRERDLVVKLHTGGGKTLVGLIIAQSTLNETGEPVLYLAPTTQLVKQTLEKARAHGIPAVAYEQRRPLHNDFINGNAIMVATYKALFHGKSAFGIRGEGRPQGVSAIVLDDAHVAFSVVRESFTLDVKAADDRGKYEALCGIFRTAFREVDRLGTFDDTVSSADNAILEVPYWAWHEQLDTVREQLRADSEKYALVWPLLRDHLHLCHALITRDGFSVTPILPLLHAFPTFTDAPRRIYMSATIADDSEIIRTFDANPASVATSLKSRSLAGVSERMILIPALMPFKFDVQAAIRNLAEGTVKRNRGAVILVPSDKAASEWADMAVVAKGSEQLQALVDQLQAGQTFGPAVFSNRYDGIDLPGDSCRLLIMSGLPIGTSAYELFRATALYGSGTIARMLAQRIEQGIGRGARGSGDHCVVVLAGADLAGWIAKDANLKFLTSATRAQLEMGESISKEVKDVRGLVQTVKQSFDRDSAWTKYHAETLAELVDNDTGDQPRIDQATVERKAFTLWLDGYHEQAISKLEKAVKDARVLDDQTRGWMEQLAARIADKWGSHERAEDLQKQAYAHNRNLTRPKVLPPYRPLPMPGDQENAIVKRVGAYRVRRGFLHSFEEVVAHLNHNAQATQFEQALTELALMLGFSAERHDVNGEGPDVLWLLPGGTGLVIEAKSRKKTKNALTKDEHGQLLVASEWFATKYPDYRIVRVCVHPKNEATKAAVAGASFALTYDKLTALVSDSRALLTAVCESQLSGEALVADCARLLAKSSLNADRLVKSYLVPFKEKA